MTEWILSSSILILVVIALRTVFKGKISLRLQYAIWGLVLLRLLIPVHFGSTNISVANLTITNEPPVIQSTVTPYMQNTQHVPNPSPEDIENGIKDRYESQGIDVEVHVDGPVNVNAILQDMLPVIWIVGFVSVAGLFLFTNARFKRKIMDSRYGLGLRKNNMDVYATGEIDTPCLVGIKDPAIYVTYPVADDPTLLRHTLEHEATHHRHGDHIWAALRCVCLAIHWYNPLVWWAAFLSQRDAELACDEATIKRLGEGERAEYGRTLIGMTCQKKANVLITATTMNSGKSGLKERIMLIAKKPKMALYTLLIVLLVASIAVGCTFTGAKDDSKGELTGTKVFTSESEVVGMGIHAHLDAYTLVDAVYLPDVVEWTSGFEYGEIMDRNAVMDPGSNAFSVTLFYADGTEKTCNLDYEIVGDIAYKIEREDIPDWWQDIWPEEDTMETDPKPTEAPDNAPPENLPEMLNEEADPDKICIGVLPTALSTSCADFWYIIPENQELLLEYFQAAEARATQMEWDSSIEQSGWIIAYNGQWWWAMEDGSFRGDMAISADYGKELYEVCMEVVKEAGFGEPVRPEDITGIISATLSWNGGSTVTDSSLMKRAITVTEPYILKRIETLFSNSKYYGSVQCPFDANLELTLENGDTMMLAIGTDSCASWMSEGVAYGYGEMTNVGIEGNEEFYSFFMTGIIHEKAQEGPDAVAPYWPYMHWGLYANKYGHEKTIDLLYMFEDYVLTNPTDGTVRLVLTTVRSADGAYAEFYSYLIGELFEAAPSTFSFACRQMIPEQYVTAAVTMLAYYWEITPEEALAKLEAAGNQN